MLYANLAAAAALLLAPLAKAATGEAIVQNECAFPVYLWSVSNVAGPMVTVPVGSNYTETYRANPNGGGISIKIADKADSSDGITQFEYTLATTIWYDISNINGYPFEQWGVTLIPSISTCTTKVCPAGITLCADAYNTPDENWATADCDASADLVLVLCSGQVGTTPVANASSIASSVIAASTAAPVSTSLVKSTSVVASTTSTSSVKSSSVVASTPSSSSVASTTLSTVKQTSTTVKTSGTTFVTSSTPVSSSSSSSVTPSLTSSAVVVAATSTNSNEVVITTYVTSWTTVDGSAPTSTSTSSSTTSSTTSTTSSAASSTVASTTTDNNFGPPSFTFGHGHHTFGARSENKKHVHRHARDIVA